MFQNAGNLDDVIVVQENEYCQSERITIFISVIYAYKGLLLVIAKLINTNLSKDLTNINRTGFWCFSGMGNTTRLHSGSKRFQTHRTFCLQRSHHVHNGSCNRPRPVRPQGCGIRSYLMFHHLLHIRNVVLSVRSESKTGSMFTHDS